jgi:hypothetical protein
LKARKVNGEWHRAHRMPANPTRAQRVEWHAEHEMACGCRAIPPSLVKEVKVLGRKKASRAS